MLNFLNRTIFPASSKRRHRQAEDSCTNHGVHALSGSCNYYTGSSDYLHSHNCGTISISSGRTQTGSRHSA